MKKLFAFISVCAAALGMAASATAFAEVDPQKTSACSPVIIKYHYDEDGFKIGEFMYDDECRKLQVLNSSAKADRQKVRPAGPPYPDGSITIEPEFGPSATYVPQFDGTLKRAP